MHVDDVMQALDRMLGNPSALGQTFNIAGPSAFDYRVAAEHLSQKLRMPTVEFAVRSTTRLKSILPAPAACSVTPRRTTLRGWPTARSSRVRPESNNMRQFHHVGLPTDESHPGEVYVAETKVWVTDPRQHPYRVEYLRFAADSPARGPVRDLPHVAFRVDDLAAELRGKQVLIEPFSPSPGCTVAFILQDGAVIEFMMFEKDSDLPWK